MKFDSAFLVRVTQLTRSEWVCLCPTILLKAFAPTRQEAIAMMKTKLEGYVNTQGVYYIDSISRSPDGVCCPEGLLDLQCDIWKCKLDRKICKLQAWIPVDNKECFFATCHASEQTKEDKYRTVVNRKYEGAHHFPGRYLCPICHSRKIDTRYHYPWELTSLSHFVDIEDSGFREALVENGISMSVISSNLCPDCFIQIISIIKPDFEGELEKIRLSFTNISSAAREEEQGPESKNLSQDFVGLLVESPESDWYLGLALASLYGQGCLTPDFGDALTLAGDWLGLTDDEADDICNDKNELDIEQLHRTADLVAWRAGWAILCGGLEELLKREWKLP